MIPVPPTIARRGACAALLVFTLAAAAACSSDDGAPPVDQSGTVGGRVMLTLERLHHPELTTVPAMPPVRSATTRPAWRHA